MEIIITTNEKEKQNNKDDCFDGNGKGKIFLTKYYNGKGKLDIKKLIKNGFTAITIRGVMDTLILAISIFFTLLIMFVLFYVI